MEGWQESTATNWFEEWDWTEAKIEDLTLIGDRLLLQVSHLVGYDIGFNKLIYERYKVKIIGLTYLKIDIWPYINGKYLKERNYIKFGINDKDVFEFEGFTYTDLLNCNVESSWVAGEFLAQYFKVENLGKFSKVWHK